MLMHREEEETTQRRAACSCQQVAANPPVDKILRAAEVGSCKATESITGADGRPITPSLLTKGRVRPVIVRRVRN